MRESATRGKIDLVSLSSHLNDPKSPVRAFFAQRFPDAESARRALRETSDPSVVVGYYGSTKDLAGLRQWSLGKPVVVPDWRGTGRYPYQTVGTALDYRVRFMFDPVPVERLVAYQGALQLSAGSWSHSGLPLAFAQLAANLEELLALEPTRHGVEDFERRIAHACYGLALYEQCFRARPDETWPLVKLGRSATWAKVIKLAPDEAISDLVALATIFRSSQQAIFSAARFVPNPTFLGSRGLGGADADFIAGPRLIDIKTTKESTIERRALWQILGYCLADWNDEHQISEVGIYFARHSMQVAWPLTDLMSLMAGEPVDLVDARENFGLILAELQRQRGDTFIISPGVGLPRPKPTTGVKSSDHAGDKVVRPLSFRLAISGRGKRHVAFAENPVVRSPRTLSSPATHPSCNAPGVTLDLESEPLVLKRRRQLASYANECCSRCLIYAGSRWEPVDHYVERVVRDPGRWCFREPARRGLRWHIAWDDFFSSSTNPGAPVCLGENVFKPDGAVVLFTGDLSGFEKDPRYCRHCLLQMRQALARKVSS